MTAPIYQEKTWQYANNSEARTPASVADNAAHFAWYILALLTGNIALRDFDDSAIAGGSVAGKWVIDRTCDSVTAGVLGDGVDHLHIGGAYTLGDWVRAAGGSAHSWAVLHHTGLGFYLCVDFSGSAANQIKLILSKSSFSTGGTATDCPTAANSSGAGTDLPVVHTSTITANRKRAALSTDGNFFILTGFDTLGKFDVFIAGVALAGTRTGEAHNFWIIHEQTNNAPGVPQGAGATILGRSATAGAVTTPGLCALTFVNTTQAVCAVVDGKDATDNALGDSVIVIATYTPKSERGRLVDFSWCPQGVVDSLNGYLIPATGPAEFMRAGFWFVPSNSVSQTM